MWAWVGSWARTDPPAVEGWRRVNRGRCGRRGRRHHRRVQGQRGSRRAVHTGPGLMCQRRVMSAQLPGIAARDGCGHRAVLQSRGKREPFGRVGRRRMGEAWGGRGWHTDVRCPLGRVQDGRHSNRRKLRRGFHGSRRPGDWPRTLRVPHLHLGRLTVCLPLLVNRTVGFFGCRRRREVIRRGARKGTVVRHGHLGVTVARQTLHTGAWRRAPSLQ